MIEMEAFFLLQKSMHPFRIYLHSPEVTSVVRMKRHNKLDVLHLKAQVTRQVRKTIICLVHQLLLPETHVDPRAECNHSPFFTCAVWMVPALLHHVWLILAPASVATCLMWSGCSLAGVGWSWLARFGSLPHVTLVPSAGKPEMSSDLPQHFLWLQRSRGGHRNSQVLFQVSASRLLRSQWSDAEAVRAPPKFWVGTHDKLGPLIHPVCLHLPSNHNYACSFTCKICTPVLGHPESQPVIPDLEVQGLVI